MFDIKTYQADKNLLKDKTIVVTGAGDGIGKTLAKTYAEHGATVILIGKTVEKLEAVYDEIEQAGFAQPAIVPLDFASATEENYKALHESISESIGSIDGIVHNAALLGDRTSISNYKEKVWNTLMTVNVTAPFLLTKALLPLLKQANAASIIFTGSSVGHQGRAYWGAYSISKAANENLMQVLAEELGDTNNIRVNSINPGATRTTMRATAYPAEDPATVKDPSKLMPLYLYLMGQDSLGVNGQQFQYNDLSS